MIRRIQPHVTGLMYVGLLTLVALAAMNNQNNLLFWVMSVMVAGLFISWLLAAKTIASLRVRRIVPRHGAVGEPLVVRYSVTNRSRWLPAFNIHFEERTNAQGGARNWRLLMKPARAWVMHIGPREVVHGEAIFWPTQRGVASFDSVNIWTTFPFNIIRKMRKLSQPQHTLIYPRLYELRRDLLNRVVPPRSMGMRISQHAGAGDDYFGLREYQLGDSMRHIAWRRTAQLDDLVVIERTKPSPAKLRVLLDLTGQAEAADIDGPALRELQERAISLAASIVHAADREGFEVGLTILGIPQHTPIAIRRGYWHIHKIMAALASIDLDAPREVTQQPPLREVERAGQIVVSPDRVNLLPMAADALYLTGRQLDSLAVRTIGWDSASMLQRSSMAHRKLDAGAEAAA